MNVSTQRSVCRAKGYRVLPWRLGLWRARLGGEEPVWGQGAVEAIWGRSCRWGRGSDAQWVPMPGSLSPEGQSGPGVVQPLQGAQVVGQRVLGIAGQDGKDHGGRRRLSDARSREPQ